MSQKNTLKLVGMEWYFLRSRKEKTREQKRKQAGHLDAELGLSPMSALSVVAVGFPVSFYLSSQRCAFSCAFSCAVHAAFIAVQRLRGRRAYRTELLVRRRIHWGTGRFCFCDLASFCLVRKDLRLCEEEFALVKVVVPENENLDCVSVVDIIA